jgi:flagellar hook protein FlgE
MGFEQALSGLDASSKALDAIGNNVANADTVGFKMASVEFADAFAAALQGGGASQIGIGTQVAAVRQQFTQGNTSTTNNPLDLSINGGGLFRMNDNGVISYTRNGQFQLDKSGYVVNAAGLQLTGYTTVDPVTGAITSGNLQPLQISSTAIPPQATSLSQVQVNLDARSNPPSAMSSGSSTANQVPVFAIPLVAGVGDSFDISIDGLTAVAVTIPPGTYSTPAALSTAIQTAINTTPAVVAANVSATVSLDSSGYLVVSSGSVGTVGSQGSGSSIALSANGANSGYANLFGTPTTTVGADGFNVTVASSYTSSTAETVYDSLGNPHTLTLYYAKTSYPGRWQLYTSLDGGQVAQQPDVLFNSSGLLVAPSPGTKLTQSFNPNNSALNPLTFSLDLSGSTQYGIAFGTNQLLQDGYTSGQLSGMSVSQSGIVQGTYSNGKSRNMGQIVLANFNNLNGLQSLGNNQWAETLSSGSPIPGAPQSGNLGLIQSGSVEQSNVDMTAELVDMITQQRNYQANAQTIKTMDQVMQTLINLR